MQDWCQVMICDSHLAGTCRSSWFWSCCKEQILNSDLMFPLWQPLFLEILPMVTIFCLADVISTRCCINCLWIFLNSGWLVMMFSLLTAYGWDSVPYLIEREILLCRKGQQLLFPILPVDTVTLKLNITHDLTHQRLRASFMQIHSKSLTFILIKAHGL